MSFSLSHFTIRNYLRHVRRQSKHVQHIHAVVFAGSITAVIAAFILHTEYGFWRDRYVAEDHIASEEQVFDPESPGESFMRFWQEAKERLGSIGDNKSGFLEGKEVYKASD